jgi:hypothetical protein
VSVEEVSCASYTHARRHPMVLGRIGGWAPPFQLSVTQIAVLLGAFGLLHWTWPLWATHVGANMAALLAVGVPSVAAWAVRRVRVEGRSLPRAALGWLALWSAPAGGQIGGRPPRRHLPQSTRGWSYLATGERR